MNRLPIYKLVTQRKRKNDEEIDIDFSKLLGIGGGPSASGISRNKNHIYFYDDVSTESCLELNKTIIELAKELQKYSLEYDTKPAKIYLHINSNGGELLACFSTVDYIKNCPIPIVSIVEGSAASAATLISVVCDERYMTPNSYMLIHQLRGGYWGKYDEMEEDLENSKKFMDKIYNIYEEHTKLGRNELKKMLRKDKWWDYDTCLEYGLVDGCDNGWINNKVVKKNKKPKFCESDSEETTESAKAVEVITKSNVKTRSMK